MITDGGSYCRHFVLQQKRIQFSEYKPPKTQKKLQGCFNGLTLAKIITLSIMNSVRGSNKQHPVRGCLAQTARVKDDQQQQQEQPQPGCGLALPSIALRHQGGCGDRTRTRLQRCRAGRDAGVLGTAPRGSAGRRTHAAWRGGVLAVQAAIRGGAGGVCNQDCLGLAKEGHLEIRKCLLMVCNCLALWFICCITLILNVQFTDCLLSTCH